jgi:hypothetical protein
VRGSVVGVGYAHAQRPVLLRRRCVWGQRDPRAADRFACRAPIGRAPASQGSRRRRGPARAEEFPRHRARRLPRCVCPRSTACAAVPRRVRLCRECFGSGSCRSPVGGGVMRARRPT